VNPACLTVDVEDWFHPELLRGRAPSGDRRTVVREGTEAVLALLRRHGARATFFVLGDVARRHPDLVRRIADENHEIACHGMTHTPLWRLDRESFRAELRDFRAAFRDAGGADGAVGFRAPTFSLDRGTSWALDVLADEGFMYDSSVFPVRVRMYGVASAPLGIYRPAADDPARADASGRVVEFPVAVAQIGAARIPVAGGFYLRALPFALTRSLLDRIGRERPFVLYIHPWECVPSVPRLRLGPVDAAITYARHGSVPGKLERIVSRYGSRTVRDVLDEVAGRVQNAT
jgi:polysaccharide deacetylase family protein (PEP-CTERM system associated)